MSETDPPASPEAAPASSRARRARKRQRIVRVARTLLRDGGRDAVTATRVSSEVGVTASTLYHYYPSLEAILRDVARELYETEEAFVEAQLDSYAPTVRAEQWLNARVAFSRRYPEVRALRREGHGWPLGREAAHAHELSLLVILIRPLPGGEDDLAPYDGLRWFARGVLDAEAEGEATGEAARRAFVRGLLG